MTDVFYKATRPDGSSFHDPDVVYTVGKRVRPKPYDGQRNICGPGVLHASRRPEDAASYADGQFALFEVEGTPFDEHDDKAGFKQLTVTKAVPSYLAFGPQGVQVQAALDRIDALTDEELDAIRDRDRARDRARDRVARVCADYVAAVAIQDLIDDVYTQDDHDILVESWEAVVGKWDGSAWVKVEL